MIKLIACDLNGTLIGKDGIIPEGLKDKFSLLSKKLIKICIISSQDIEGMILVLEKNKINPQLGYPHYLICAEREIYYLENGEYKAVEPFNSQMLAKLKERKEEIEYFMDLLEKQVLQQNFNYKREKGKFSKKDLSYDFLEFSTIKEATEARQILDGCLKDNPNLKSFRSNVFVTVVLKEMDKGQLLSKLVEKLGVSAQDVLVIGDSANDESLFAQQFLTATVGNAEEKIKQIVKNKNGYIANKFYGEGVLEVLDNLCP